MAKKYSEASFLSTKATKHTVKGEEFSFYPVSVGMAFRLKTLAEPLGLALAAVFKTDSKSDVGRKEIVSPTENGAAMQTTIDPISMQLAQFRAAQTNGAVVDFVKALAGEDTQKMLAELVMDSLRDFDKIPPEEFLKVTPLDAIAELLTGVVAANKGVFGPLALKFSTAFNDVKNKVVENLASKAQAAVAAVSAKVGESNLPTDEEIKKMGLTPEGVRLVTDLPMEPSPTPATSVT